MNKNNGAILLVISLSAGIAIGYFASGFSKTDAVPATVVNDDKIRALENQLEDARAKINTLQEAALASSLRSHQTPTATVPQHSAPENTTSLAQQRTDSEKIKILEGELAARKAKEMNQWLLDGYAHNRSFDPGEVMQKKFDAEAVDVSWAKKQEEKLINTLANEPDLAGFALRDTQCKSSLCQISFSFTDMDQANKIAEQVSKSVAVAGKYTSVVASPNKETKLTTLYISSADTETVN